MHFLEEVLKQMATLKTYTEDLKIAKSLINRDEGLTRRFFYQQCYPLFKSIFDNYYTDCIDVKEFVDEVYILVIAPSKKTGRCQMENYKGESTLATWLKTVCLYYCYHKFELKKRMPLFNPLSSSEHKDGENEDASDIIDRMGGSIDIDFSGMNRADVETLLDMMPNKRYSRLIRLLYLEQRTHKEVAESLGMSMDNYYNKRRLAEAQFKEIRRKEEQYG